MASRLLLPSARAWLARWRATPPPEGWALFGALVLVQVVAAAARLLPTLGWDTWWAGDPFVYACLADSLVAGRGFHIDYVAMHIQRYAGAHGRPEDYAGPLLPLLMVPFVALLGRVFAAYAAPSILCHALLLPLALRAVALRCGAPVVVAQASAWMSLFHPALFANSQRPMTDVVFATLIVLAVYWSVRLEEGLSRPAWAGVFVGLAALTRSTGQLYLPAFAVANALRCRSWRGLLTREVIVFGAVAMLVQAPWLWRNEREFGRPMHSVGSRLVGLMGRS
ncbi:MAG: glycosyltransferase family 39 protein, partial [Armatimonadetes bacterium]|nr:glycosyltransferase family 39 protein [Armatimonadota bacterium]